MEPRLIIAYTLIALMVVCAAAAIAYAWYNPRDRMVARQRALEDNRRSQR